MKNIQELFVPYELAVKAKEKGFNELVMACYDKNNLLATYSENIFKPKKYNKSVYCTSAPLYQQLVDWFREEKNIEITQVPCIKLEKGWFQFNITRIEPHLEDFTSAKSYYKAINKALKEAFKLI